MTNFQYNSLSFLCSIAFCSFSLSFFLSILSSYSFLLLLLLLLLLLPLLLFSVRCCWADVFSFFFCSFDISKYCSHLNNISQFITLAIKHYIIPHSFTNILFKKYECLARRTIKWHHFQSATTIPTIQCVHAYDCCILANKRTTKKKKKSASGFTKQIKCDTFTSHQKAKRNKWEKRRKKSSTMSMTTSKERGSHEVQLYIQIHTQVLSTKQLNGMPKCEFYICKCPTNIRNWISSCFFLLFLLLLLLFPKNPICCSFGVLPIQRIFCLFTVQNLFMHLIHAFVFIYRLWK